MTTPERTHNDPRHLIIREIGDLGAVPGGMECPFNEPTDDGGVVLFETCDGRLSIVVTPDWWEVIDEDAPGLPDDEDSASVVAQFYDVLDACRYVRHKVAQDGDAR